MTERDTSTSGSYRRTPDYDGKGLYRCDDLFLADLYRRLTGEDVDFSPAVLRFKLYRMLSYDDVRQVVSEYLLCRSSEQVERSLNTDDDPNIRADGGESGKGRSCSRCGTQYGPDEEVWVPLDAVVHAHEGPVCEDCVKVTDEVVDV